MAVVASAVGYLTYHARRNSRIDRCVELLADLNGANVRNPAQLTQVVNSFRSLDQNAALEALTRFDKTILASKENIDTLLPLIFKRKDLTEKFPSHKVSDMDDYVLDRDHWPGSHAIEICDGIPFGVVLEEWNYSGKVYSRKYLIKWAKERGVLVDQILLPTNDPFATADTLIERLTMRYETRYSDEDPGFAKTISAQVNNRIRDQVYQMVAHLVPDDISPKWSQWADSDESWEELRTVCLSRGLRWNPSLNAYVLTR